MDPSACWTGFVIEALATCMADMVGLTSHLTELTKDLRQVVDLLIQT